MRHQVALIALIVCRIWQGRTRIGQSVRQRPPRFSNITESVGCLHVPHQVPGTFVDYAFLFYRFSASGGWVKVNLELPHLLPRMYQIHVVFRFNPRSRGNSSWRCWYRTIKLELPHLLPRMYQIHVVFRINPRSGCNSSSRCWYRAREHVDPA